MRKVKIHDGKLAIDVKNIKLPQYPDWFEDGWFGNYDIEETFLRNELLEKIEKTLNEFYPELHCEVNVAGKSDGWIELEGFWSVESVDEKHGCWYRDNLGNYYEIQTEHDLIYDCVEMFEFLVNASISIWFQFWQNIIDRICEEVEE